MGWRETILSEQRYEMVRALLFATNMSYAKEEDREMAKKALDELFYDANPEVAPE